jgi:hypothetical protein
MTPGDREGVNVGTFPALIPHRTQGVKFFHYFERDNIMTLHNRNFLLNCTIVLVACTAANAQEGSKFTFNAGAGFTEPVGNSARHLDTGWTVGLGAGYNITPHAGIVLGFDYTNMGINSGTLSNIGFPGGGVRIWDFTLDPIVHITPHKPIDFYLSGGPGVYHHTQEFTAPGFSTFTAFDPFFGFYQAGVPSTQILSSYSVVKPGINVGGGFAFGSRWHARFYAEARYNKIFLGNNLHTDYIPVSFGVRF